jgi:hypothetical protein
LILKKQFSEFYAVKKGSIVMVEVQAMNYLMVHGEGVRN